MRITWGDIFAITFAALVVAVVCVLLVSYETRASTDEREAIEDIAIIDEAAMEQLAAALADPAGTPACRAYADVLLYAAATLRFMFEFPESTVVRNEVSDRIMPSVPAYQYACENAV